MSFPQIGVDGYGLGGDAINGELQTLAGPPLTSCSATWFLKGSEPVYSLGVGDTCVGYPAVAYYIKIVGTILTSS